MVLSGLSVEDVAPLAASDTEGLRQFAVPESLAAAIGDQLAALAAQAQAEGRFLGGRPPYGYMLVDIGPHPNPAKAADAKRLQALAPHPQTAWVVRRIFADARFPARSFKAGHAG